MENRIVNQLKIIVESTRELILKGVSEDKISEMLSESYDIRVIMHVLGEVKKNLNSN